MGAMDRIRALRDALPEGGSVTLTRDALEELLAAEEVGEDLTVDEIARRLGRTAACVRSWAAAGKLPGAYRLQGREWRVPAAGLRSYLDAQAGHPSEPRRAETADLSAWRRARRSG